MQVLIEPLLREVVKATYKYAILFVCSWRVCIVSVALTVCVSCKFVYDAVDINKIITISSIKLPSYVRLCTSDCRAKTIPWLICQAVVNILS